MHGLALGVRHAGILSKERNIPRSPKGSSYSMGLTGIGTQNATTILSMFGGPLLRTRTYTVDLIHFLVLRRIYTVFLCYSSRTTGAARWSGLALPVCGVLWPRALLRWWCISKMSGVLHQRFPLVPCCQSKQYGWE